jgi:putative ABC transport system permease protein
LNSLKALWPATSLGLRSIPQRLGTSLVVVIGVAIVVAVFVTVLSMASGFTRAAASTGRPDRAIVISTGANTESSSSVGRDQIVAITNAPGIRRAPNGDALISAEALAFVALPSKRGGLNAFATVRGVGPAAARLRPEVRLVEGRMFSPGKHEVIVGKGARSRMDGLEVGQSIAMPQSDWQIVGIFESGGDSHESELMTDAETLMATWRSNQFNTVTLALDTGMPRAFEAVQAHFSANPSLSVRVVRETEFFEQQSQGISRLLRAIAYGIGGIMAFGAAFGAVNTMYTAVSARAREIATLRAIGFGAGAVVASVLIEALVLSLAGAAIGASAAWLAFNDVSVSAMTGTTPSQLTFALDVNGSLVLAGALIACGIGMLGGLLPAIRAGLLPVASAMRAL